MKSKRRQKLLNRSPAQTREIREAVFARADGICECGECGRWVSEEAGHLDHFFSRGKEPQTIRNCWGLHRVCDNQRTRNMPSAAYWLGLFIAHCGVHGYVAEAEKAAAKLQVLKAKGRA